MEETITLPNEINRLCRTCMTVASDDGQFCENALFEEFQLTYLGIMLQDLTSSEISNDGLPTVLCDACVNQLKQAYYYKKQCDEVKSNLKELLMLFDGNDTNCEEEFEESKLMESENFKFSLADNTNEFVCKICAKKFDSRYKLSRDMIEHNKNKNLLVRYHEGSAEDTKENIIIERVISDEILNLVKTRKNDCIQANNSPFEIEMSDKNYKALEDNISQDLEIEDVNYSEKSSKPIIKKIVFLSNLDSINNTEIIRTDQTANKNLKKILTPITCKHCNKKFSDRNKCKLHYCMKKQNKNDDANDDNLAEHPTNCDLCNKVFPNSLMVSIHFIYHILLEESIKNSELLQEWIFCNFCGQVFETEEGMDEHKQTKHDQSLNFPCERCGISFDKDMDLILHEDQDHADYDLKDTYQCPICGDSFESKLLLLDHGVNHLMKKICCRACRLEFCTQASLNEHMKIHPRYKYVCNICGKCLSSSGALKSHMMGIHNKDSLYMCTTCGKCFKTGNRLRIHKEIHSAHKKYMCSYCGYRSHKSGDLKLHLRIHTSEHPYKCTFVNCNRVFKTSSHFNQHIRRHLDIKQYQCSYCSRKFSHSYTLKLHKMRHTGEKPHSCIICHVKFRRRDHLRIHMKQHEK
ncbi:zinc finger protein 883-like [Agrilus planipennis]|uniref:Wilms tumor protein homolog n=1 Tax=Agrilus planipennis TaxID=224129 RepID=A0A7F5R9M4_AGRPL|nr:zinc finger protein 883-like [Agrilus planipennis]